MLSPIIRKEIDICLKMVTVKLQHIYIVYESKILEKVLIYDEHFDTNIEFAITYTVHLDSFR